MMNDGRILNKEVLKKKWNRFWEAAMILLLWKILHYRLQLICWWDEKQLPSIIYLGTFDKNINTNHWVFMKRYKCPKGVKMLKRGLQFEKRIREQPIIINLIYYCKNENIYSCKKVTGFAMLYLIPLESTSIYLIPGQSKLFLWKKFKSVRQQYRYAKHMFD